MVIAIDGPAGAGKSTVARDVARALGFTYLDSGALYRTVALAALERGIDTADGEALAALAREAAIELRPHEDGPVGVILDGRDVSVAIREPRIAAAASEVAAQPQLRAALVERQRSLIEAGNYVAEGRDIGTVIAPDAPVKVFLTAAPEERARRRATERGEDGDQARIRAEQEERDRRDRSRSAAPLRPAPDAVEIDTTGLSRAEVVSRVVELARERGP